MNGISVARIPRFIECEALPNGYNSETDLYSESPASNYNLNQVQ